MVSRHCSFWWVNQKKYLGDTGVVEGPDIGRVLCWKDVYSTQWRTHSPDLNLKLVVFPPPFVTLFYSVFISFFVWNSTDFYPEIQFNQMICAPTAFREHKETFVGKRRPLFSEKQWHRLWRLCKECKMVMCYLLREIKFLMKTSLQTWNDFGKSTVYGIMKEPLLRFKMNAFLEPLILYPG